MRKACFPSWAKWSRDRKSTRLNSSHGYRSYAVFCLKKKIDHPAAIAAFVAKTNEKYRTEYSIEFFSSPSNACFRVRPAWAFGLTESDFTVSPTRWPFSHGTS